MPRPSVPDGARRRQGARQDLRARWRATNRRQEKFFVPQRLGARLLRGADGFWLQGGQPQRQADVRMWRIVRRMTTREPRRRNVAMPVMRAAKRAALDLPRMRIAARG